MSTKKPNNSAQTAPPQNVEIEKAVIGGLLIDSTALDVVTLQIKKPQVFFVERHRLIFEAILNLQESGHQVETLTVTDELKKASKLEAAGGVHYIFKLSTLVSSTANITEHCSRLNYYYYKRELVRLGADLKHRGFEDGEDPDDLVNNLQKQLDDITGSVRPPMHKSWQDVLAAIDEDMQALSKAREEGGLMGIPSGINSIDEAIGGWLPGELVILAARPGMGKTAMVVKWLVTCASMGVPCAIMQLEMTELQFGKRVMALQADGLHANQFYKHGFNKPEHWKSYSETVDKVKDYPLHIIPKPGMNISECERQARALKKEHGIQLLVVDYLQLMSGSKDGRAHNREQEISEVSRKLKALSLDLQIPVIALSQLSRSVETRGGEKRPLLSDLRESGSIEQDADMVCFLYRPEYYGIEQMADGSDAAGVCEFIIAKHRNGSPGTHVVGFDANKVKFKNIEEFSTALPQTEDDLPY